MNRKELKERQSLSLDKKIELSNIAIRQFYEVLDGKVYVAFSGGKDSTVLVHLIHNMYPEVPIVFVNTGLEYPEIIEFVKSYKNVTILRSEKSFSQVIKEEGYPVISKKIASKIRVLKNPTEKNFNTRQLFLTGIKKDGNKGSWLSKLPNKWKFLIDAPFKISERCCDILKKKPIIKYEKETGRSGYVGLMASDSLQRENLYLRYGCNIYGDYTRSRPIAFWTVKDIWEYLKVFKVPYCSIYDKGEHNTGCIFCMFGINLEKHPNRFERMKILHPQLYIYCMEKLGLKEVLGYINKERPLKSDI